MNKTLINIAITTIIGTTVTSSEAALTNGSRLAFNSIADTAGTVNDCGDPSDATPCTRVRPAGGTGSWFSVKVSANTTLYTGISSLNGIELGATQGASGAHGGVPGCTPNSACNNSLPYVENPSIDNPWGFFLNTGMHQTTSDADVLNTSGNAATIDFSGWSVTWNDIADIPLSGDAFGTAYTDGVANVVCALDCGVGDTYTLDYRATVPMGDPSGFGGVVYELHLEGSVVPVPAVGRSRGRRGPKYRGQIPVSPNIKYRGQIPVSPNISNN